MKKADMYGSVVWANGEKWELDREGVFNTLHQLIAFPHAGPEAVMLICRDGIVFSQNGKTVSL